jgi:AraC family transcriptional regulator
MRTLLIEERGLAVTLARYAGGEAQPRHRDRRSRISLLLRGGFREDGPGGSTTASPGNVLIKSHTAWHEDVFAPGGAVLLSVELDSRDSLLASVGAGSWRLRNDASAMRFAGVLLESALAKDAGSIEAASADLLDSDMSDPHSRREPPGWLTRLKLEVESASLADTRISDRAQEAGVHPAHVSRLFRRCFGRTITDHAQAHAVRRAFALMARPDARLSEVALAAGFYDQAHMNRAFRRVVGCTPGAHRRRLEAAVQLAVG